VSTDNHLLPSIWPAPKGRIYDGVEYKFRPVKTSRNTAMDGMLSITRDQWTLTSLQVKEFWKDFRGFQKVFPDLLTNLEYDKAICRAVLDYNIREPENHFTPASFPRNWYTLLLEMSWIQVLKVIINFHAANYFTGSSGGTNVITHERVDKLEAILQRYIQTTEPIINRKKTWKNEDSAYGGTSNHLGRGYYYGG
jgi:hypothetical protein